MIPVPAEGFRIASGWIEVLPDLSGFRERLQAELDAATSGAGGQVHLGLDDSRIVEGLSDIRVQLEQIDQGTTDVRLTLEDHDTGDKLEDIKLRLDEIGAASEEARVHVDTGDSTERLAALDAELRSKPGDAAQATSAFGGFSGMMYAVAAAVPVAAAALPALGGALAGVGGAAGAVGLAFGGVSQAISDYTAMQNGAGQASAQMAATQFANAVALQNAQRAVSDAEKQAAQDAVTSAASIVSAQQQVAQSEHAYADALYGEQQAQVALVQAREQARQQLEQLNNAEIDGKLSVRAAQLALQQAQESQQQTDANAMSTQLQREQAALAVAQAERQLIEARQGESHATDAANKADKQGVDGNPQVIAAQHALRDAIYQVHQARQAEQNAIRALTAAREQAAFQQQRDAEAVQVAEQNLANTQRQQQLQMAASGNAAQKFARDMAALSGPQRALVREFESFSGVLTRMERIAGKAVLPGVTTFLHGVHALLPTVESGLARFGRVAGQIFATVGQAFSSKAFRQDLESIITQGVRFMRILEPVGTAVGKLFDLWGRGGPATAGLAKGLAAIATGFGNLFQALEPAVKPAGEILATLGKAIGALGKPIGEVLAALVKGLAPVLVALLPAFRELAGSLGRALVPVLVSLGQALVPVAQAIAGLMPAITPLISLLGTGLANAAVNIAHDLSGLSTVLGWITGLLRHIPGALELVVGGLIAWAAASKVTAIAQAALNLVMDANPIMLVVTALAAMVGGLVYAYNHVTWFHDAVQAAWKGIEAASLFLWHDVFDPMWQGLKAGAEWFYQNAIQPLWNVWIGPVFDLIKAGIDVFKGDWSGAWKEIGNAAKVPVNFLIGTIYDNGIRRFWDDVVNAIGLSALDLPKIATLSQGGRIPGYGGGDVLPALLEPGETVVDKDTSRVLAPIFGAAGVPGYSLGGIVGNVGNWFSHIGHGLNDWLHKAFDIGKIVAALSTGNSTALVNAIDALIGHKTPAAGELAKVMITLPHQLFSDAAKHLVSMVGLGGDGSGMGTGSQGGLGGSATGNAVVKFAESWIGRIPYVFGGTTLGPAGIDCSGFTERVYEHFGFSPPRTSEEQFGWVQRTLKPVLGGLAFFTGSSIDPPPGHVGIITGLNQMVDAYGTGFGVRLNSLYGSSGTVMGFGVPPGGGLESKTFDRGGWLPPGWLNGTGRPEAVLTPDESTALKTMARALAGGQGGGAGTVVHQYFYGQHPNVEQQAQMRRDLALLLGG